MSKTAMVRARVTPQLKSSAEEILKKLGVSSTDAITMFYMQIVLHKAIPFEIRLEAEDKKKKYTKVKNPEHLKKLIDGLLIKTGQPVPLIDGGAVGQMIE